MTSEGMVLVSGLLCTRTLFAHQVSALSPHITCLVADHGRHASIPEIATSLLETAPERFVLAGLSMGGYVAFEVLRQAPARVAALILLDTSARPDTPEQTARRKELVTLAEETGVEAASDALLPLFVDERRADDEALAGAVRDMARETGVEAFRRQQTAIMARPDSRPDLPDIVCPALVIVGEGDRLTPPELSEEMVGAMPDARLVLVPECGHLSPLERPQAVTESIQGFLASL